jgi:hypothetical protein
MHAMRPHPLTLGAGVRRIRKVLHIRLIDFRQKSDIVGEKLIDKIFRMWRGISPKTLENIHKHENISIFHLRNKKRWTFEYFI